MPSSSRPRGRRPQVAALLSDDNRGIVLWVDQAAGSPASTSTTPPGRPLRSPQLLESFADPDPQSPPGAPRADPPERRERDGCLGREPKRALGFARRARSTRTACGRSARSPPPTATRCSTRWRPDRRRGDHPVGRALRRRGGGARAGPRKLMAARGIETAPGGARFGAPELVAAPGTGPAGNCRGRPSTATGRSPHGSGNRA